jgi:predicted acyltransferase
LPLLSPFRCLLDEKRRHQGHLLTCTDEIPRGITLSVLFPVGFYSIVVARMLKKTPKRPKFQQTKKKTRLCMYVVSKLQAKLYPIIKKSKNPPFLHFTMKLELLILKVVSFLNY